MLSDDDSSSRVAGHPPFRFWEHEYQDDINSVDSDNTVVTDPHPEDFVDIRELDGTQMPYHTGVSLEENIVKVWHAPTPLTDEQMQEFESSRNMEVIERIDEALVKYQAHGKTNVFARWPAFYLFVLRHICHGWVALFRFIMQDILYSYSIVSLLRCRHNLRRNLINSNTGKIVMHAQGKYTRTYKNFFPCVTFALPTKIGSRELPNLRRNKVSRDGKGSLDGTKTGFARNVLVKYMHRIMKKITRPGSSLRFNLQMILSSRMSSSNSYSIAQQITILAYGLNSRGIDELDFLIEALHAGKMNVPDEVDIPDGDDWDADVSLSDTSAALLFEDDIMELDDESVESNDVATEREGDDGVVMLTHTCSCGYVRIGNQGHTCGSVPHILPAGGRENFFHAGVHAALEICKSTFSYRTIKGVLDRFFRPAHGFANEDSDVSHW